MGNNPQVFQKELEFQDSHLARELFGPQDNHLELLWNNLGVRADTRGSKLFLYSEDEEQINIASNCLIQIYDLLRSGHTLYPKDLEYGIRCLVRDPGTDLKALFRDNVFVVSAKKTITPKTLNQRDYLQSIREKELVFGIGPAGTGKTYLAVAMAVSFLLQKKVQRLILTRPALEAGEKLGFLPGDLLEKVNPYLRPLYDALHDMLDFQKVQEMIENGIIEIAPLAFMRGRTLNNAFIILDEAQNTTPEQMKMFLTRIGFGSNALVTGDITQIDLPFNSLSGLVQAQDVLADLAEVEIVYFQREDVIRHELVGKIVQAYENHEKQLKKSDNRNPQ
ncbi:MAG TPA: PhoH family protein [Desulfohalobiaceae bacterium]|nr:PhoH family protein [Desulfohalobiaceae bacterium]